MSLCLTRSAGLLIADLFRKATAMQGDGILFELSIGLWITGPALTPDMTIDDFTPASFTGYAALTAQTFGAGYIDQTGRLQLTSPTQTFICSTTGTPQNILGYYAWREGTPDVLIFADQFTDPIVITSAGDGVAFAITFDLDLTNHGTYQFSP